MDIGQFTCQPLSKGKLFTVNNLAVASLPTFFTTDAIRCKLSNRTATGRTSVEVRILRFIRESLVPAGVGKLRIDK